MDIWVDTGLLVHTVYEEGAFGFGNPFGLKSIAIMNQEALGLDVEKAANEEQIELKESIKKNGGSVTKESFEIYKADLDILSKYASAFFTPFKSSPSLPIPELQFIQIQPLNFSVL